MASNPFMKSSVPGADAAAACVGSAFWMGAGVSCFGAASTGAEP